MSIQYRELLQNISNWLWEIDAKYSYTYCSENISQTLGFDAQELIGKTPFDFMSAEEAKRVKNIFTLHTSNQETIIDCETLYIHKDGHEITAMTNAIPILNKNGNVVGFQGLAKDISEDKKRLQETAILEERLELALWGSKDGVWDWNILDNSVYFSPRWKEMLGYSDEELINEFSTWSDRVHPDDIDITWDIINEHINSETEYYEGIHRLKHKDGHWVWILDRGKALYDESGKAIRMIGTHTDISEEKAIQLKAIHQKQIIEQIHDSVISTDLGGFITDWNSGSEILLGYSAQEAIGKHLSFIYLDEDLESLGKNISTLMTKGENYVSVRLLRKSGEILQVDLSLSLLKDENSNAIGMVGYAKDITQKKKAEETLEQQSRMAQMGEMISMIGHQWRQPLNAISLTASNLKLKFDLEEFDSKSQKDFKQCTQEFSQGLENIQDYIRTLSTTIDDFRNFYKTDKVSVNVKLEEIASRALKIISPSLIAENVKIIEEYDSDKTIELYDNEIMQVILTILQNAQDNFLEKKTEEPSIKIITKNRMISICDNGGGVPENILDKIFDPYFSTKSEKNGTGLGLYMGQTIIEKHHKGKLKVKNSGDGACFTITL
ncbi:MAG: PAS domain S-box protein [Campylobacterota bacterium]